MWIGSGMITSCAGNESVSSINAELEFHADGCTSSAISTTARWELVYTNNTNVLKSGSVSLTKLDAGGKTVNLGTLDLGGSYTCMKLHLNVTFDKNVWTC